MRRLLWLLGWGRDPREAVPEPAPACTAVLTLDMEAVRARRVRRQLRSALGAAVAAARLRERCQRAGRGAA